VRAAIIAVKNRQENEENRTLDFVMRPEQELAVEKTIRYYFSSKSEESQNSPHFLRNAKMRF
jgi:hypothetical protein